ncbi:hypothetical protein ACEG19_03490 [Blautia stercoris]|uniref:hypothetical protein n=1 Tax=Blautia stercoris TaxID=871664 RepID=UPI00355ADD38
MIYYKNYDEKVKKITGGYELGNVYDYKDYKTSTEIEASISSFDDSSHNFHILYELGNSDSEEIENRKIEIIEQIKNVRQKLIDVIKVDDFFCSQNSIFEAINSKDNRAKYIWRLGNRSSKSVDPYGIEKYIAIYYKNFLYMICFETLYVDNKMVNCIIGKLQYYRCLIDDNRARFINKNEEGEFDCCYPKNSKDKEEKSDKRGIYNSDFTVEDNVKEIIQSFKEFLKTQ